MSVEIISHKGKQIIYSDYPKSCQKGDFECMLKNMRKVMEAFEQNPSINLNLANFEGTIVNAQFMKEAKGFDKLFNERGVKSAVIGLSSVQMILLSGLNKVLKNKTKPFHKKIDALDYLASF